MLFEGDLFDEGDWVSRQYFDEYVTRFESLFAVSAETEVFVVAGNHDIGFHYK
jgi:metallophosphoesterase superfamily enzyme